MPRERAKERACDAAIKRTLAYRAVFKYPLSYHQLANTLISDKTYRKDFFDKELAKMVKKGYVGFKNGKYFDKRIKPISWDLRFKHSQQYINRAKHISRILRQIPWVKLIAVTGSAAAFNADRDDDIDFFIIAQNHRLWLTRGFVTVLLKITGLYAQNGQGPGKICPNLYIDDTALEWPVDQRSIFTAHEIVMMHPLVDKEQTYLKFLAANSWIKDYFADFRIYETPDTTHSPYGNRVLNVFEKLAMTSQTKYMNSKRTNEIIDKHVLHFKKNDNTSWILEKFTELKHI